MPAAEVYSLDKSIADFFSKTFTTREECDEQVVELYGTDHEPAPMQGNCSYTVYAGQHVLQFRLQSRKLEMDLLSLARKVYGDLVPKTEFHGVVGHEQDEEPLYMYSMSRAQDLTYIELRVSKPYEPASPERKVMRMNLVKSFAGYFVTSWTTPQQVSEDFKRDLRQQYLGDLRRQLTCLPERFHAIIQKCIDDLPSIFTLPLVLTHQDLNATNIFVDEKTCNLKNIVAWAEANVCPFGFNLRVLRDMSGAFRLKRGCKLYEDHDDLYEAFWSTFQSGLGRSLTPQEMDAVISCRAMGCLLSWGFTRRLANEPTPRPVSDEDDEGRCRLLMLDGLLVNPDTELSAKRI